MAVNVFTKSLLQAIKQPQFFQIVPIIVEVEPEVPFENVTGKIASKLSLPFEKSLPRLNMFSMTLPTKLLPDVGALQNVNKIYLNRPHYALSDFNQMPNIPIADEVLKYMKHKIMGTKEGWIPTTETLKSTKVYDLHDKGITGQGVRACVLDTGTSAVHPQLSDRIAGAFTQTAGTPHDGNGHGSFCCTALGGGYWEHPVNKLKMLGVAPDVELFSIKVLTDVGNGDTMGIMRGIQQALDLNCDVISMSLGSNGADDEMDDPMVRLIEDAKHSDPSTVFVIAAGNSGPSPRSVGIPSVAENCICVGAYNIMKSDVANFSSRGPTIQKGDIKPDILAPGVDMYSGLALSSILDYVDKQASQASPLSGTSMATPHMAGIVSLWKQFTDNIIDTEIIKGIFKRFGEKKTNNNGYGLVDATWIEEVVV